VYRNCIDIFITFFQKVVSAFIDTDISLNKIAGTENITGPFV